MIRSHASQIRRLSERWRDLEHRLKEAEQITGDVTIPAINELRYSGRRFFEAWLIADKEDQTEQELNDFHDHIRMAEQYFNNADRITSQPKANTLTNRQRFVRRCFVAIFAPWVPRDVSRF